MILKNEQWHVFEKGALRLATQAEIEKLRRAIGTMTTLSECCGASINDFGYCTDCKEHAA